ncbi:MAG: hypothetical protein H6713_31625 [Myxococcales bacterium]|nr:hypothetical protein [Myxococcales bacterium]MCB9754512.1 hypothetical protein [Myxococcales bacterium]
MKKAFWFVVLVLCAALSYLSFQNGQPSLEVQRMSKDAACKDLADCEITVDLPYQMSTSSFGHKYFWGTTKVGNIEVACKREYMFVGNWQCARVVAPSAPVAPPPAT